MLGMDYEEARSILVKLGVQDGNAHHALLMAKNYGMGYPSPSDFDADIEVQYRSSSQSPQSPGFSIIITGRNL